MLPTNYISLDKQTRSTSSLTSIGSSTVSHLDLLESTFSSTTVLDSLETNKMLSKASNAYKQTDKPSDINQVLDSFAIKKEIGRHRNRQSTKIISTTQIIPQISSNLQPSSTTESNLQHLWTSMDSSTSDYSSTDYPNELSTENFSTFYGKTPYYNNTIVDRRNRKKGTRTRKPNKIITAKSSLISTEISTEIPEIASNSSSFSEIRYRNGSLVQNENETINLTQIEFYDVYEYYDSFNNTLFVREINGSTHRFMSDDFYDDQYQQSTVDPPLYHLNNITTTSPVLDIQNLLIDNSTGNVSNEVGTTNSSIASTYPTGMTTSDYTDTQFSILASSDTTQFETTMPNSYTSSIWHSSKGYVHTSPSTDSSSKYSTIFLTLKTSLPPFQDTTFAWQTSPVTDSSLDNSFLTVKTSFDISTTEFPFDALTDDISSSLKKEYFTSILSTILTESSSSFVPTTVQTQHVLQTPASKTKIYVDENKSKRVLFSKNFNDRIKNDNYDSSLEYYDTSKSQSIQ